MPRKGGAPSPHPCPLPWTQVASGQGKPLEWFHELTLTDLTEATSDLTLYCDLAKIVGPRGSMEARLDGSHMLAIAREGGELSRAMAEHLHPGKETTIEYGYLCRQIPTFLLETQLPKVWQQEKKNWFDYSRELSSRAKWRRANRQEWLALAEDKLATTLRRHFPTLELLLRGLLDDHSKLAREFQRLGDHLLPDVAGAPKLPFVAIEEMEAILDKTYGRLVAGKAEEGAATDEMLALIHDRVREGQGKRPTAGEERDHGDETPGPKPDQVVRAMQTDQEAVKFEAQALTILGNPRASLDDYMNILAEAFSGASLPPKAVLIASKGRRTTSYTAASDFLTQLHDLRHHMARFLAMSLTFDEKTGQVPPALLYLILDELETRLICDGEWVKLDPFNKFVLRFKAEKAGTKYDVHDTRAVYHDPGVLVAVTEVMARLFDILGYPKVVDEREGVSYRGFMALIAELLELAQAMEKDQQVGAFRVIDDAVADALRVAGQHFVRLIYTANPAGRKLTFWLAAHEPLLAQLKERLESSREQINWRRRQGAIYGQPPTAPPLLGHTVAGRKGPPVGETPRAPPTKTHPPAKKPRNTSPRGNQPKSTAPPGPTTRSNSQQGGTWSDPPDIEYHGGIGGPTGKFSTKGWTVDWPGVCKHFGWDPKKLHGPWVMAPTLRGDYRAPDSWKRPTVDGKPFFAKSYADQLQKAGLLKVQAKPPGGGKRPRGEGQRGGNKKGGAAADKQQHFA